MGDGDDSQNYSPSSLAGVNFYFKLRGMENGLPNLQRLLKKERRQKLKKSKSKLAKSTLTTEKSSESGDSKRVLKRKRMKQLQLQRERENILPSSQEDGMDEEEDCVDYDEKAWNECGGSISISGDYDSNDEDDDDINNETGVWTDSRPSVSDRIRSSKVALADSSLMYSSAQSMEVENQKFTLSSLDDDSTTNRDNIGGMLYEDDW